MEKVSFRVAFSDGWVTDFAEVQLPFALITFKRGQELKRARFDLDKMIFIDSPPSGGSKEKSDEIVKEIAAQLPRYVHA